MTDTLQSRRGNKREEEGEGGQDAGDGLFIVHNMGEVRRWFTLGEQTATGWLAWTAERAFQAGRASNAKGDECHDGVGFGATRPWSWAPELPCVLSKRHNGH
jgi:hypothetical protein